MTGYRDAVFGLTYRSHGNIDKRLLIYIESAWWHKK